MAEHATKIVATLGPASADAETLRAMIAAGLDVARVNFSHADHDTAREWVARLRALAAEAGRPLAILGDLQGPKVRLGPLDAPLDLAAGARLTLAVAPGHAGPDVVSCDYPGLPGAVAVGGRVYLRDGTLELEVTATGAAGIDTRVLRGGRLSGHDGVNLPGAHVDLPALSAQDRDDLRFAAEQGMDYVALSFVRRPQDVRDARAVLDELGMDAGLIAKIETRRALETLDGVLDAADGVMVARGDLAVEVGPELVPVWQRRIIAAARRRLIPAIVATEMLESMRERATPTRAEASDVAHAVWDGADAVMLSAESAVGRHPVEAVAMMDRILREAESVDTGGMPSHAGGSPGSEAADHAIGVAVGQILAGDHAVRGVVAFTVSGYSARLIAAAHPRQPVLALTPEPRVRARLALVRGVTAVRCEPPRDEAEMLATVDREARAAFDAAPGDTVVLVGAMPIGRGHGTNFLALHRIA